MEQSNPVRFSWKRMVCFLGFGIMVISLVGEPASYAKSKKPAGSQSSAQNQSNAILRAFQIGICVGDALSVQHMTIPMVPPGQQPSLDSPTQAAFEEAVQTCQAKYKAVVPPTTPGGALPSPSPSPSP